MRLDVLRAREETPGCKQIIHFNNAGAALMPSPVLDAVMAHLQLEAHCGGYEAALQATAAIQHVYDAAAKLLRCAPGEIAFVESATRAWDMAFYSVPLRRGDRILTSTVEYASNYISLLNVANKTGAVVEIIPNDEAGQISIPALRSALDERVKLIAITHIPTNGGLVNPVAEVGQIAREASVLFLLDACQSVGQIPIDVGALQCDILSTAGRKYLRGPRGTGLLYVRRGILDRLDPPLLDVQSALWIERDRFELRRDACRFENWETSYASKIGLGVAIDYALQWGLDAIWSRISMLAGILRAQLARMPRVTVQDQGATLCGIVSFTVSGKEPEEIHQALHANKINVWTSELSLTRLDMEARGLTNLVRASVHYYNTEEEIEQFCAALAAILGVKSVSFQGAAV